MYIYVYMFKLLLLMFIVECMIFTLLNQLGVKAWLILLCKSMSYSSKYNLLIFLIEIRVYYFVCKNHTFFFSQAFLKCSLSVGKRKFWKNDDLF